MLNNCRARGKRALGPPDSAPQNVSPKVCSTTLRRRPSCNLRVDPLRDQPRTCRYHRNSDALNAADDVWLEAELKGERRQVLYAGGTNYRHRCRQLRSAHQAAKQSQKIFPDGAPWIVREHAKLSQGILE